MCEILEATQRIELCSEVYKTPASPQCFEAKTVGESNGIRTRIFTLAM